MKTNPALWERLDALDFDKGPVAFGFADRLARDNDWSIATALRAIHEYKRFVYLAMVSGHEVTPSDEVDQVWHLHLTYTRHYWGPFAECLGAPLHHGPTTGSSDDKTRFDDNYLRTRQSYEAEFGEYPPEDLWPPAEIRFGEAPWYRRINTKRHLVLPVPQWLSGILSSRLTKPATATLGLAVAGGVAAQAALASPAESSAGTFLSGNGPVIMAIVGAVLLVIVIALVSTAGKAAGKKTGSGCGGTATSVGSGKGGSDASDGGGSSGCSGCGGCGG